MTELPQPPQALPDILWGDRWRFASIAAGDIVDSFGERAIPVKQMPDELLPLNLGIASTAAISGIIIYGGQQSMQLARWLAERHPFNVTYVPAEVEAGGGLLLEAHNRQRWILATFNDREVAEAATIYETRKKSSRGLHFLIVQPDDSGMTYSGFWLLQSPVG